MRSGLLSGLFFLLTQFSISGEGEPVGTLWSHAPLHRKYIKKEGFLDPEDWILIYRIPKGRAYRLMSPEASLKPLIRSMGTSVLHNDRGTVLKGETMLQVFVGGRIRLHAAACNVILDYDKLEEQIGLEHATTHGGSTSGPVQGWKGKTDGVINRQPNATSKERGTPSRR
jgi:hypothetical protein